MTGHVFEFYVAAMLYCVCKFNEIPIKPAEVADVGDDLLTRKRLLGRSKTSLVQ